MKERVNMAKSPRPGKPLTPYKQAQAMAEQAPREQWCGQMHGSIEEAIAHAELSLDMRGRPADPYIGKTRFSDSAVVGWQVNDRKRYRLDYTPTCSEENIAASKWSGTKEMKGSQGVHVNEENFEDPVEGRSRVCHPTAASLQRAEGYWQKWTVRFHRWGEEGPTI